MTLDHVRRRALVAAVITLVCTAVLVATPGPAGAQQEAPEVEVTGFDLSEFPTVRMRVALGRAATSPSAAQIEVREDGELVEARVSPLAAEPVGIVLAVDTSGSIEGQLERAATAMQGLLDRLPDDAPVSVVGFGSSASVVSDFTLDRAATASAIDALRAAGGTALYDAVILAAEQAAVSATDRTAVVLLSDGADSESSASLDEAQESLAGAVDDLYVVSLQTADSDPEALTDLAEPVGGRILAVDDAGALDAGYAEIAQRIVNQYEVVFTSRTTELTGDYEISVPGTRDVGTYAVALPDRPQVEASEAGRSALPGVLTAEADPGPLQQPWVLWLGALLVAGAGVLTVALVRSAEAGDRPRRSMRRSLRSDAGSGPDRTGGSVLDSIRTSFTGLTSRAVERAESTGRIDKALDRAGLAIRAGEYVAVVVAVAAGAGLLGFLLFGPLVGLVGVLVPVLGSKAFLDFKTSRRNAAFAQQLGDALMLMSGSLRSGFGLGQTLDTVAQEMDDPIGAEFQRAILEARLGRDLESALAGVADRVRNEDFEWVVDAMRINRQVGGDLAGILDQVGETIRARNRLERQVSALTAEGRISALVLAMLPVGMGLVLYTSNPDYMDPLFSRSVGWVMLGVAGVLLAAGVLWLKKLIDIEY